jgi:tripartite-type tricarboxylate transporter receptor subunit TctC
MMKINYFLPCLSVGILSCVTRFSLIALFGLAASIAHAWEYPNRPIRLVVPFSPGGGADTVARVIGQSMSERMLQPVVIENRGGAGGLLGTELVARASADGYTLLLATQSTHGTNPSLYKKLPYDPMGGFQPITLLASVPNVLVVHPSVAAGNVQELIAIAKRRPGILNYASVGVGSSQQLVAELFKSRAGIDMVHVPYKGTGPALTDLMSGQVQVMFTNLLTSVTHLKRGNLKGLAVASTRRSLAAPELPLIADVLPGFEASSWYGLLTPSKTPAPIVAALNKHVVSILLEARTKARLTAGGAEPEGGTPQEFAAHIREEIKKYAEAVKLANIQPE